VEAKTLKIIGIVVLILLVLNLVLFAFRIISSTIFWISIGLYAIFSFLVVPKLKKEIKS